MRLSLKKSARGPAGPGGGPRTAADLSPGEGAVLDRLDLPEDVARRLMEMGFVPGQRLVAARRAPSGDPRVFRVDGSEVALRKETAVRLLLRPDGTEPGAS